MRYLRIRRSSCWATCLVASLALCLIACGGGGTKGSTAPKNHEGRVIERAEGYSSKPAWADENRPWSRSESQIRVVGYVTIAGEQRMEAGYRAADSYARAELLRFLSVRIVAVLEDKVAAGEPEILRESIEETAQAVIDDLPVSGRYYERRKAGSVETLHIYSRIDLEQATVLSLLERALGENKDLRTSPEELLADLKSRWDRVADVEELNQDETLLPNGFPRPTWAEKGDRSDASGFEFVCSGIAEDPKLAQAVAQARCNEKLCRLFGVQITAKSKVTEDLDGISAENEVTEQCAEVRVEGRTTRYQASECGPQGCVHWFLQAYPKSAYLAERKRLDQPKVIRQEVVIQEGDKRYRDPAACENSLRAYGSVSGQTAAGFSERKKHLTEALKVCQDIDGRESGLFLSMNNLLQKPLSGFTRAPRSSSSGQGDPRWAFSVVTPEWLGELETMRFLTDRISAVLRVVDGAILPLELLEIQRNGAPSAQVERALKEVMQYPFVNQPLSEHHFYYIHDSALSLFYQEKAAYSPSYRRYLLDQVVRSRIECTSRNTVSGESVIAYLGADKSFDDEEWSAIVRILKNSPAGQMTSCFSVLRKKEEHGAKLDARVDEVASLLASGTLKVNDGYSAFERLLTDVDKDKRAPLYFRYVSKLSGSEKARARLVENVTSATYGWQSDYQSKKKEEGIRACESLPQRMSTFFKDVPDAKAEDTALCMCLKLDGVSKGARRGITALLFEYADKTCDWIQPEDWPETYYEEERPKTIPFHSRKPFVGNFEFIKSQVKECIEKHSVLRSPNMATYLAVTLQGARMSAARAETTIYGTLKKFEYKDKRRGYVRAADVVKMEKSIQGCIETAANSFIVPEVWSVTKEPGSHRLWFQLWNETTGTNGFESDLQK